MSRNPATGQNKGVLILYTGGTIGSRPGSPDPDSPRIPAPWGIVHAGMPEIDAVGFPVACHAFETPLDSCNVGPREWAAIANAIGENYDRYEGFVVLHGTDTMVYTASALSFMLHNLGKPVVVTGAQRSALVDLRNDATQNLVTALRIANPPFSRIPLVPEVCIFFGGKLLRGNRAIKRDAIGYDAYESPNFPPLGSAGLHVQIEESRLRPIPSAERRFFARTRLDTRVTTVFIHPGIQDTEIVRRQLADPTLRAAVVYSFGTGTIPTRPEFLDIFRAARERGLLLAVVTQCVKGRVDLGIYHTSAQLVDVGFVSADDITLEAAVCKLMALLGDPDLSVQDVEREFRRSLAGEQSVSLFTTRFPRAADRVLQAAGGSPSRFRIPRGELEDTFEPERVEKALLRFHGAQVAGPAEGTRIRLFANLEEDAPLDPAHPGYLGSYRRWPDREPMLMLFDVAPALRTFVDPTRSGERVSFTVVLDTPGAEFRWKEVDLAVYVRE